jgi:hypothetical protein
MATISLINTEITYLPIRGDELMKILSEYPDAYNYMGSDYGHSGTLPFYKDDTGQYQPFHSRSYDLGYIE